jgi:oligoendopeptidase F
MDGSSFIHKDKNTNSEKTKKEKTKLNELYKEMEEIESNFNGEICEKDEIKILENELDLLKKKIDELKSKM